MGVPSLTAAPAAALSAAPGGSLREAVSASVLKKAIDLQSSSALQLVQSLPAPQRVLPPNLGTKFNASA